jgi:hypothetical protein
MTFVFVVKRVGRRVSDGSVAAPLATGEAADAPGEAGTAAGARDFRAATAAGHFCAAPRARHSQGGAAKYLFQPKTTRNDFHYTKCTPG